MKCPNCSNKDPRMIEVQRETTDYGRYLCVVCAKVWVETKEGEK